MLGGKARRVPGQGAVISAQAAISKATELIHRTRSGLATPGSRSILNLNVEAGGERCILEGDTASGHVLTDIGFAPYENARSPIVKSVFEYGPKVH